MINKELLPLSPSRIRQLQDCSWLYYCSAILKLPQEGNDGSRRGSSLHDLLEHLVKPRHYNLVKQLLKTQNPAKVPVIARFLEIQFKKQKLNPEGKVKPIFVKTPERTNREEVYAMLMTVVNLELKEPNKNLISTEYAFDYIDPMGFRLKGFIDMVNKEGKILRIRDWKTSKKRWTEAELNDNLQAKIYTMVGRDIWPGFEKYLMRFVFTRFPEKAWQDAPEFPKEEIIKFKLYLRDLSKIINNFDEKKASLNLAKNSKLNSWLCGRGSFRCPYRDSFDYWALCDKEGKTIKSSFERKDLKNDLNKGEFITKKHYNGCPGFNR